MMSNIITKFLLKIFDKNKYNTYKYNERLQRSLNSYNKDVKDEILKIDQVLKNKKIVNFLHSGHLGDIVYSLPLIKEISKDKECNLFIQVNKKMELYYHNHPSGNVMINKKTADLFIPLLQAQPYISSACIHNNENIDIDLNLFRSMPFNLIFHSMRWYSHLTGTPINMQDKFLEIKTNENFKNKIIIVRSPRYRNQYINYKFLENTQNIVCVGLTTEYEELKNDIKHLEFHDCKDFLEMAEIINSGKFFIGNLGFAFSIAEGLKKPRLLEACPDFPVIFPLGANAYDFYHQIHFEKYFKNLNNIN